MITGCDCCVETKQSILTFSFKRLKLKSQNNKIKNIVENPGIDPGTSHMLSERSTT